MKVKYLIELLKQHNPEAEVHIQNDRGYYEFVGVPECYDSDAAALEAWGDEDTSDPPTMPVCNGDCGKNSPVVIYVD